MKAKVLLLALLVAASLTMMTSCTSSRSGCKATAGYVGYGTR